MANITRRHGQLGGRSSCSWGDCRKAANNQTSRFLSSSVTMSGAMSKDSVASQISFTACHRVQTKEKGREIVVGISSSGVYEPPQRPAEAGRSWGRYRSS